MGYQKLSGLDKQVPPDIEQLVGAEVQERNITGVFPTNIEDREKRIAPLPARVESILVAPASGGVGGGPASPPVYASYPVAKVNRYIGADLDWQELVRWDITPGYVGDLHEIAVSSDNDAKTRYHVIIGNRDQQFPTDRTLQSFTLPFSDTAIPGGTTVFIAVLSTDGTTITVDGSITGTERIL